MSSASGRRKVRGVDFVVDEDGQKKAVVIDLKQNRSLWEDFYDSVLAEQRKREPRETLEEVKEKVHGKD